MNKRTDRNEGAREKLSRAISAELERAREAVESREDLASNLHEARRAIKRARALVRLAHPWPSSSSSDVTLRDAGRALAPLRDADVLILTAKAVDDESPAGPDAVPPKLFESLEQERERGVADPHGADGPLLRAGELLRSASVELQGATGTTEGPGSDGLELLRHGLRASYASAREGSDPAAWEGMVDERSHKLRKRVKDLRYQLEFLDTGQPALGLLVTDLHRLTDLLGDANDLVMLSCYTASVDGLSETERTGLIDRVDERKESLRSEAALLAGRLFEEEPDAFVGRVEAWLSGPAPSTS